MSYSVKNGFFQKTLQVVETVGLLFEPSCIVINSVQYRWTLAEIQRPGHIFTEVKVDDSITEQIDLEKVPFIVEGNLLNYGTYRLSLKQSVQAQWSDGIVHSTHEEVQVGVITSFLQS